MAEGVRSKPHHELPGVWRSLGGTKTGPHRKPTTHEGPALGLKKVYRCTRERRRALWEDFATKAGVGQRSPPKRRGGSRVLLRGKGDHGLALVQAGALRVRREELMDFLKEAEET